MSFNTAISGLNAASTELNVIGNNVANASTNGFKMSRTQFSDVYPVSSFGASPHSPGVGVKVDAITQQFTQGNVNFTNRPLDLAVTGDGFFRLSDNGAMIYSRAGAFGLDANGYISNNNNQRLTGYLASPIGNLTGALGELQVSLADLPPSTTTAGTVGVNLNAVATASTLAFDPTNPATYNNATSVNIYDSLGATHLVTLYFDKNTAPPTNSWIAHVYDDAGNNIGNTTLAFDGAGALTAVNGAAVPPATAAYTLTPTNGANAINFTFDFGQTTQYGSAFDVNFLTQDGYTTGRLAGVDVDGVGIVRGRYTNGQSLVQGQVVLSNFVNAQGLKPLGDTNWAETALSGAPLTGAPATASLGLIQSGALEDSNVNLTEQLVQMITAQRNFQANAQMIQTQDAITQTIINLR